MKTTWGLLKTTHWVPVGAKNLRVAPCCRLWGKDYFHPGVTVTGSSGGEGPAMAVLVCDRPVARLQTGTQITCSPTTIQTWARGMLSLLFEHCEWILTSAWEVKLWLLVIGLSWRYFVSQAWIICDSLTFMDIMCFANPWSWMPEDDDKISSHTWFFNLGLDLRL